MSRVRLVDEEILRRFNGALSESAPAVRAHLLHPGAEASDIQQRFAGAGLRPSREALAWWGYFDATPVESGIEVLPRFWFLNADQSVRLYRWRRERAAEAVDDAEPYTVDDAYGQQWIPLFSIQNEGDIVLDCASGPEAPSPVREMYPWATFAPDFGRIIAPSLGELLIGATQWIEQGDSRWEPQRRLWWPTDPWRKDVAELFAARDRPGAN